ncbi:PP2C family protein-serine/threonine phosphatase [Tsuneonella sp. HG222]
MADRTEHLTVLVVDDDEMLAEFVAIELEARRCSVRIAASAPAALAMLDEGVDVLLTDWQMPGMDGMELVRRARENRSSERHLHITMMTAREDQSARIEALRAGVDDFLLKPVDPFQLDLALSTARRNRMLQRRLSRRNQLLAMAHARTREALRAVRSDIAAAAALHQRSLPRAEQLQAVRAAHLYHPATGLGGDTMGTSAVGDGLTLFFLIDVRGHGVPAALESFHLHHRLKQYRPDSAESLAAAVARLNREIEQRGDESYATMVAGILDAPGGRGWLVRAGHPLPLLDDGSGLRELGGGEGMPLGWFADVSHSVQEFPFPPGARLILYSDGLTDCHGAAGGELGEAGLKSVVETSAGSPLADLVATLQSRLDLREPADDVSMLALESTAAEETKP